MSTRSRIGYKREDGKYVTVYCHWDGYPEHNGKLLVNYYNSIEDAKAITELGDLSILKPRLYPIGEHSFDDPEDGTTVAYRRDRGEDNVDAIVSDTLKNLHNSDEDYTYLFEDGKWTCYYNWGKKYINLYTSDFSE